jgi:hypothetical protein
MTTSVNFVDSTHQYMTDRRHVQLVIIVLYFAIHGIRLDEEED